MMSKSWYGGAESLDLLSLDPTAMLDEPRAIIVAGAGAGAVASRRADKFFGECGGGEPWKAMKAMRPKTPTSRWISTRSRRSGIIITSGHHDNHTQHRGARPTLLDGSSGEDGRSRPPARRSASGGSGGSVKRRCIVRLSSSASSQTLGIWRRMIPPTPAAPSYARAVCRSTQVMMGGARAPESASPPVPTAERSDRRASRNPRAARVGRARAPHAPRGLWIPEDLREMATAFGSQAPISIQ